MTQQKGVLCPQAGLGPHPPDGGAACQTAPGERWHQKVLQCPSMWLPRSALQLLCSIRLHYPGLMPLFVCLLGSEPYVSLSVCLSVRLSVCLPIFRSVCNDLCPKQLPEAPVQFSIRHWLHRGPFCLNVCASKRCRSIALQSWGTFCLR